MSWWITRRNPRGGREIWLIDVSVLPLLMLVGLLLSAVLPVIFVLRETAQTNPEGLVKLTLGLLVMGIICLFAAKVSLFRQGIWRYWGPGCMTSRNAWLYRVGYAMIGVGTAILVFLALVL